MASFEEKKECGFVVAWLNSLVPRAFPFCVGEGRERTEKSPGNEVSGFNDDTMIYNLLKIWKSVYSFSKFVFVFVIIVWAKLVK